MTDDRDEVVRIATGPLVDVELWQTTLREAGIESRVVGAELTASFGTAMPDSIELWVHQGDAEKALAALRYAEEHRGDREPGRHGPPQSDRRPNPER
jgi:hypothetical protein